jgi:uncharacterized protein YkwD
MHTETRRTRRRNTKQNPLFFFSVHSVFIPLERLEIRILLSASDPSGDEQQTLELINRMRQNPAAELPLLENSTDPAVQEAFKFFNVNLTELATEWATLTAAPPLAWNADLATSALGHDELMLSDNTQSHQLPGEPDLADRATAAGYTNYSTLRESVFAYATSVFDAHASFAVDFGTTPTGIQDPPGHRENIMAMDVSEVGIAEITGPGSGDGSEVGPLLFTEDFGSQFNQGNPFLLGSVYNDTNGDGFYTSGEGLAGVTVQVVGAGGTFNTTTLSAGGYQVQVPAGTYSITFSGGSLSQPFTINQVVVGTSNVERDYSVGAASTGFISLNNGVLSVPGTAQNDILHVKEANGSIIVNRDGSSESLSASGVDSITISGGAGDDSISIDATVSIPTTVAGGPGNDMISGGGGSETLKGGGGNDSITAGLNGDSLLGGAGSDTLVAGGASLIGGILDVEGTPNSDTIGITESSGAITVSDDGADGEFAASSVQSVLLHGLAGADSISVDAEVTIPAVLAGGAGPDTITGGGGSETLQGGLGADSIIAGSAADSVAGGQGADTLTAGDGGDIVSGGLGSDLFFAINQVADTILGGGGNDTAHVDMGLDSVTGVSDVLFT